MRDSGLPEIARVNEVVLLRGEPVTVMVWLPVGAPEPTVKVTTAEQLGEQELGATEYETPEGTPESESETASELPAVIVLVIVFWVKALPLVFVTLEVPEFESE